MIHPAFLRRLCGTLARLRADRSAVAFLEFALALPLFTTMMVGGVELANYVTTKMRVSQLALHLADHVARIGTGTPLAAKKISETQINDVLIGAGMQAGKLDLFTNGRVIVSSLESDSNNSGKFKIAWQRCRGLKTHTSSYGNSGQGNLNGIGPSGRQVIAPPNGATIFVEVYYVYQPIITTRFTGPINMTEIAAMPVRDTRDLTQIYNTENATVGNCNQYTS